MSFEKVLLAEVNLWGNSIGYVAWNEATSVASFEYDPAFVDAPINVELAPLTMLRKSTIFQFTSLEKNTFKGLPGLLADCLPDKFGNALIDVWLAKNGRRAEDFNPVKRLCYIGKRAMGALEFKPAFVQSIKNDVPIVVEEMVKLASDVLHKRNSFKENIRNKDALANLLLIGSSAGGARAKCLIAYNKDTGEVRSGKVDGLKGFDYWILKLDGVSDNRDKELNDLKGFGAIEYGYHLMAIDCGIEMTQCELLKEKDRLHFMTKRFDRLEDGQKLHMQSLCAIAHYDFNMAGAYSYEQALEVIRKVVKNNLSFALEQQFRRAVFNIMGRNQDDHTKNIAFLMDKQGNWKLSPAFDLAYSYNPEGVWTSKHQMSLNGKREKFSLQDLLKFSEKADLKKSFAIEIIKDIANVFSKWKDYAEKSGVINAHKLEIQKNLNLKWS